MAACPTWLWIVAGQQRYDTIEGLNNQFTRTPNLRKLMDESVEMTDIAPTLLEAWIPVPSGMQGRSLGALLRGERQDHRDSVYCEHFDSSSL